MDMLILRIARAEASVATALRAFAGWWMDHAVDRGLRALDRIGQKSDRKSGGRQ